MTRSRDESAVFLGDDIALGFGVIDADRAVVEHVPLRLTDGLTGRRNAVKGDERLSPHSGGFHQLHVHDGTKLGIKGI